MVHKRIRAVLTGRSTVSGFDLAWFSSLSSKRLCVFGLHGTSLYRYSNFFAYGTSFSFPISELMVGLALDLVD